MPHLARVPRSLRAPLLRIAAAAAFIQLGADFSFGQRLNPSFTFRLLGGRGTGIRTESELSFQIQFGALCQLLCACVCVCVFWPLLSHVNPSSSARHHQTVVLVLSCMKSESAGRRLLQSATTTDYRGAEKPRHMSHSSHESQSQYTQAHIQTPPS